MNPHLLSSLFILLLICNAQSTPAKTPKPPPGGPLGVVVDERLSALRTTPDLRGKLVRRITRGKLVAVRKLKVNGDGIEFYLVNLSTRTHGWVQREALAIPSHKGADQNLLSLIESSSGFDRIVRARILLNYFPTSRLRPKVLLTLGDTAEELSLKLSSEAARRLSDRTMASESSYFLNYSGLDRYNRQGVTFLFDTKSKRFHYDGSTWRELVKRYPNVPEAIEARRRLKSLSQLFSSVLIRTK